MKTILHKADSRGHANHGWLNTYHTFSFAGYCNPERNNFGALRVLNDDVVAGGMGFGAHPHNNMEIISIPLKGSLRHEDNLGNKGTIEEGEIQVMSAGTGIVHSEMNGHADESVNFLQIWLFPREMNTEPRYDQKKIENREKLNHLQQIVTPYADEEGVQIGQDAWFHLGKFDKDFSTEYTLKKEKNGVYAFVLEGRVKIGNHILDKRDGLGINETNRFLIEAVEDAEILLIEVPMLKLH